MYSGWQCLLQYLTRSEAVKLCAQVQATSRTVCAVENRDNGRCLSISGLGSNSRKSDGQLGSVLWVEFGLEGHVTKLDPDRKVGMG